MRKTQNRNKSYFKKRIRFFLTAKNITYIYAFLSSQVYLRMLIAPIGAIKKPQKKDHLCIEMILLCLTSGCKRYDISMRIYDKIIFRIFSTDIFTKNLL